jgi:hypothetical protein
MARLQFQISDYENDLKSQRVEIDRQTHQLLSKNKELQLLQSRNQELENSGFHMKSDLKQIGLFKVEADRVSKILK